MTPLRGHWHRLQRRTAIELDRRLPWPRLRRLAHRIGLRWPQTGLALDGVADFRVEASALRLIHPACRRSLTPPAWYSQQPVPAKFTRYFDHLDPALETVRLHEVFVVVEAEDISVVTREGKLVAGLGVSTRERGGIVSAGRKLRLPPAQRLPGTTLLATSTMAADNYYHWMLESLPRLQPFLDEDPGLGRFDHVLVDDTSRSYQRDTLRWLGVPPNKLKWRRRSVEVFFCETLEATTHVCDHLPPVWAMHFLRDRLTRPTEDSGSRGRSLFLSRQGERRCLRNEPEIIARLKCEADFEVFAPGQCDVLTQLKVFQEAAIIVGSHGAAFSNLLGCRGGTRVIELFEPGHVFGGFWAIASELGLPYAGVVAEPLPNHQGFWVPPDLVVSALRELSIGLPSSTDPAEMS